MANLNINWTQTQSSILPAYNDHVIAISQQGFFNSTGQIFNSALLSYVTPSYVKYVLRVRCEQGAAGEVILKKSVTTANNYVAFFNVEHFIQDHVQTDIDDYYGSAVTQNVDSIHFIQKFEKNKKNLRAFDFSAKIEYEFDGTVYETPYITQASGSGLYDQEVYFWNGVAQRIDGEEFDDINFHYITGATKLTLTNFPTVRITQIDEAVRQKIQPSQHQTIAFFNGSHKDQANASSQTAEISKIVCTLYNANGSGVQSTTVDNTSANSGAAPSTVNLHGTNTASFHNGKGENALLYFGCGTKNLVQAGIFTSVSVGQYYTVEFKDSSNAQAYQPLIFDIVDNDCKGFETIRLAWLNSLGTWDYYNFNKLSTRSRQNKRTTFKQNYGYNRYSYFPDHHTIKTYQGGSQVVSNNVAETIEANTDFITEAEAEFLKHCFASPVVQLLTSTDRGAFRVQPVIVKESEYVKKTTANDQLIQYTIELEIGHNHRVQKQ